MKPLWTSLALLFFLAAPILAQTSGTPVQDASLGDNAAARTAATLPVGARIVYTFSHPQLQPARFTITFDETGAGHFASQPGNAPVDATDGVYPAPVDRPIRVGEDLRTELFRYAREHSYFATSCERNKARLAFTGTKTLSYAGKDGHGSCSFVWAADPVLQSLSDQLQAVATTLEIGRRLAVEEQHDRLGLDAELESLQDAVQSHRAEGLANIAPELQTIAADDQVMNRARQRAVTLLSRSQTAPKAN
jgi:hypothetical protein